MPIVVSGAATPDPGRESFVFGGFDWNDYTTFRIQDFDPGIAPKRWRWVAGADSDGALPADEAHYDNAEMTMRIRIMPQASMDNALAQIGNLVLTLQECEKQPLGQAGVWTPAGSTKSLTAYVVGGEVTGVPKALTGDDAGWLLRNPAPVITVKFYRRPFLYGAEVTNAATVTNTNRFQLLTVASVPGDVDAEARLVVTDGASQPRRHVELGREQRYYNAATNLSIDSFVTAGFSGTSTTRSGSFNTNVVRGTLTSSPVGICGLGNLSHVGSFRVKLRAYVAPVADATADDFKVRLSWREGDGPLRSNDYVSPVLVNGWSEVDLGTVSIPEKTLGTQRWTGQVEAYSEDTGDVLDVDYLLLIPTEGYGIARAPLTYSAPTSFTTRDSFSQTAGALTGKTADLGGSWVGIGDPDDFTVETTGHTAQRTAVSDSSGVTGPRFVNLLATFTSLTAQIDMKFSAVPTSQTYGGGITFRGVDLNNFAALELLPWASGVVLSYRSVIGGAMNAFYNVPLPSSFAAVDTWFTLRVAAGASGVLLGWIAPQGSALGAPVISVFDPTLATGGVLASGEVGFFDHKWDAVAATRNYDNFWAASTVEDSVVFSGRSAEIRHDSAIRQDSTGTYYGLVNSYRGDRFYLPSAGSQNRTSRILIKARRNDINMAADDRIADSTTATVHYTPRYYVAPR